ncbi:hypothetical protein TW85_16325 [Marinomonas sp. S3726]|uniref:hypothetical protein n=1 Tax=Marinomonas sp. S3726 TaxID=579484 RepID=UPI0005F9A8FD|nr:hypothetical protein [Marinomonas sp. S3726]KJZ11943.1 hypothetical protein TW85_16325 [Marinomonas sp. S3726]
MKKSRKAPLLCTTVFPGAGYFILEKPWHGGMALLVTLLSLVIIMKEAMFKADIISKEILAGEMSFDPILITQKLMSGPSLYGSNFIEYLSLFLFSTWLVTVLDCYRLGKKMDNEAG